MKKKYGKLAIIIIPVIVALAALYPTYNSVNLEEKYESALERSKEAESVADSIRIMDEFKKNYGEEYDEAKSTSLQLGLDLKGGMYVTLEVDVVELIKEKAIQEAVDETFEKVLDATEEATVNSDEPVVDLFVEKFEEIAEPEGRSLIYYFDIGDIQNTSDEDIVQNLKDAADEAIKQAQEVIRQRIDKYGVSEPNIQEQGARRIVLELPGVTDESQIRNLLETTAQLEFKLVRQSSELLSSFKEIDKMLAQNESSSNMESNNSNSELEAENLPAPDSDEELTEVSQDTTQENEDTSSEESMTENNSIDTTSDESDTTNPYEGMSDEEIRDQYQSEHPFTRLFGTFFLPENGNRSQPVSFDIDQFPDQGKYSFSILKDSIPKVREMISRPEVRSELPYDIQVTYSAKPINTTTNGDEIYGMYILKKEAELKGDVIVDASKNIDPSNNQWVVNMEMNSDGSDKWSKITGANVGKRIAIVLDGSVYSAPNVNQKINGGRSQISGMADLEEANLLEIVLKAGALKAPVQIIEEKVVGASLGEDSINAGVYSVLFAFALVILFMIMYYSRAGFVADVALFINILIILSILAALKGTLTLPGIAGIVLTMGMAVDANILIFERIREELYNGRSLRSAIDEGFNKALSAVLDSNITTFITGIILFYVGTGLIQGFALTLMIGILSTLFTAIVVSKAMIELQLKEGGNASFSFGQPNK